MIELTLQGRTVEALEGESLLELARREGHEIPTLCHYEALEPYGACRVCLVEVCPRPGRPSRLAAACTHAALPGIEVTLDSERVVRARAIAFELLLARAPESESIRALARRYGVDGAPRFGAPGDGPADCILCGLCDRVCHDIVGADAITLFGRGRGRDVGAPLGDSSRCIACGACEALCPTSVLHQRRDALERMRRLAGEERRCRYALMGLLPKSALCANDFRCERCETEHGFVDSASAGALHPLLDSKAVRS